MISDEQRQAFLEDGYLIFDPKISLTDLDEAILELESVYLLPQNDRPREIDVAYRDDRRIQDAWRVVPSVKRIATAPVVLEILSQLFNRKPLPFQTLNFRIGTEQKIHSDTIHFNSDPSGFMCGVWVALEDIDMSNGPVVYFPGSQRLKEAKIKDVDRWRAGQGQVDSTFKRLRNTLAPTKRDSRSDYEAYERYIETIVKASGISPRFATIIKGQAFLWAANLLHGGSRQEDRLRTRHSQVTHYFFDDCRYYTPLQSNRFRVRSRRPSWIE